MNDLGWLVWIVLGLNCLFQWSTSELDKAQSKNIELLIQRVEKLEAERSKR